ncbi:hypothetical protein Cgig2_014524 [Carnegiea gigantea]|uniref:PB1-like domain-containing protein n=1 Tax=Carnegiea gigantea TaxID=171969 RepID=A0A9Q1KGV5_9CARY|nr:hypothetical protein Cgig2_014524 [Carnegiea gigantea]
MGDDDIVVEIHHGGKFVDGVEVECIGGEVFKIEVVDIDRLSRFQIVGLGKDIGFTNMEKLRSNTWYEFEKIWLLLLVRKRLVVYLVYRVNAANVMVPEMPALHCPSTATQQSNVDLISSNINDIQQAQTLTPTPTPTPTSADTHISSPTITTQKPQSHDTISIFNANNKHDKLIEGDSLREESDDSKGLQRYCSSVLKTKGKRKINVEGVVDDDGCENDGDQHDLDTDVNNECRTEVEDLETSDEE